MMVLELYNTSWYALFASFNFSNYTCFVFVLFCAELGITDNHEIIIADVTTPRPITVIVKYEYNME